MRRMAATVAAEFASNDPRNPLQAHHLSYDAYNATGRTRLADLETLCRRCHQEITRRSLRHLSLSERLQRWWWCMTRLRKVKAAATAVLVLWFLLGMLIPHPQTPSAVVAIAS